MKWQFAFPLNVVVDDDAPADDAGDDAGDDGSSAFDVERFADLYNNDGGAAAPLENGNFVVEFGKLVHSGSAAVKGIETRVFEVRRRWRTVAAPRRAARTVFFPASGPRQHRIDRRVIDPIWW